MRKLILILMATFMVAGLTNTVRAQVTGIGDAGAKLVAVLTITKAATLNFGTIAIPDVATTVTVNTGSNRSTTSVKAILMTDPVTAGLFDITGANGYNYSIILPPNSSPVTLTNKTAGGGTMTIDNFVSKPKSSSTDALAGTIGTNGTTGTDQISVGATLHLSATQIAGQYTGEYPVIITYN